mmetsp:Transcript_97759/g.246636  ORF Transcript_97759/g.246636 Transcript_97759/m.246636 type:complete len:88 (-) Transcript_97759:121-384(-)
MHRRIPESLVSLEHCGPIAWVRALSSSASGPRTAGSCWKVTSSGFQLVFTTMSVSLGHRLMQRAASGGGEEGGEASNPTEASLTSLA